jgi:hypothetical protein
MATGQTSKAEAFVMGDDTSGTHTASDHRYFAALVGLTCGTPTAAVLGRVSVSYYVGY